MNPVILDINLFNNFNSIWNEIGTNAKTAIDNIANGINQLYEKIVDTVNEIQVLQGALDALKHSEIKIALNSRLPGTIQAGVSSNQADIDLTYTNNTPATKSALHDYYVAEQLYNATKQDSASQTKETSWLEDISSIVAHANSLVDVFELMGGKLPKVMEGAFKFSKTLGSVLDVGALLSEAGIVGEGLLAAGSVVDPLLLVPLAISLLSGSSGNKDAERERKKINSENDVLKYYSEKKRMEALKDISIENQQSFKMNDVQKEDLFKKYLYDPLSQDKLIQANPDISLIPQYQDVRIDKVTNIGNSGFYKKAENVVDNAIAKMASDAQKFGIAKVLEDLEKNNVTFSTLSYPFQVDYAEKSRRFLNSMIDNANNYENKTAKSQALSRSNNLLSSRSNSTIINLNKPLIGNFTIHVKDSKEAVRDMKKQVEEALLEIINQVNSQH